MSWGSRITLGHKKYYCTSYDISPRLHLNKIVCYDKCVRFMHIWLNDLRGIRESIAETVCQSASVVRFQPQRSSRAALAPLTYIPATSIELYIHLRCLRLRVLDFRAFTEGTLLLCTSFRIFKAAQRAIERWRCYQATQPCLRSPHGFLLLDNQHKCA
jgi:hypothetical protein